MNTEELKRLASEATPITTELYGDRYFNDDYSRCDLTKKQDAFLTAANPTAILALIAERDELLEALRCMADLMPDELWAQDAKRMARAAITKAESK